MKGRTTFNVLLLFMAFFLTWGGEMTAQDIVFQETFANCEGKGGNDDTWSGISRNKSLPNDALLDNAGWSFVSANAANGCASIGTSKALGSATTPALAGLEGDATLTFRAGAWAKDATSMVLSIAGGGELSETEITLLKGEFSEYTVNITGGTSATQITFAAKQKSGNRFMLDDVTITSGGGTPSKPKAQLTFDATTATATLGEAFTAPMLTTTPEGIAVTYSSSDTGVATVDASTGAVTPIKAGTTIITATFAGNDDYTEASASYELTVISNEAADGLYAAGQRLTETAQTFKVKLTDAVITYVNGNNAYIEDTTGGALIYYADHGFVPGQKIDGVVTVTGDLYGSTKEFTDLDASEATVTDGTEIPVTELTVEELVANVGRYESCRVKISNAVVTEAFSNRNGAISQNGTELGLFQKDAQATIDLDVNGTYDFVGYPGTYNGAAQLNIWAATDVTPSTSTTIPITIATDEGYTTLYTDQAYTLPEGLKATSVQYAGNGSDLSMGWEYAAGDIVPAQTALLIQSLDGKAGEYTAEVASDATGAKQPTAGNCLYGTAADETPADDGQSHYYKLTYSNVDGVKTLGFYWDNETGAPFANKGGKAYLKLPKEETAAVKGFTIGGGAVTGISGVTTDSRQTDAVYTISGVRVQGDPATLPQGIYIVGGKKVLVK